jgi:hypothetical protein
VFAGGCEREKVCNEVAALGAVLPPELLDERGRDFPSPIHVPQCTYQTAGLSIHTVSHRHAYERVYGEYMY